VEALQHYLNIVGDMEMQEVDVVMAKMVPLAVLQKRTKKGDLES
jgi:hypothetical protein